jgi:hypothetical protein
MALVELSSLDVGIDLAIVLPDDSYTNIVMHLDQARKARDVLDKLIDKAAGHTTCRTVRAERFRKIYG